MGLKLSQEDEHLSGRSVLDLVRERQLADRVYLPGKVGNIADIDLYVGRADFADRIQELHIKIIHILIELIEREVFPENY